MHEFYHFESFFYSFIQPTYVVLEVHFLPHLLHLPNFNVLS